MIKRSKRSQYICYMSDSKINKRIIGCIRKKVNLLGITKTWLKEKNSIFWVTRNLMNRTKITNKRLEGKINYINGKQN
jgi:hypothetical protein